MKNLLPIFTLLFIISLVFTSFAQSPWIKHQNNPVLSGTPGGWDAVYIWSPFVLKDADTLKMWYSGYDGTFGRIGYATSTDGVTWTKHPNPVLSGTPGSWDAFWLADPFIIISDDTTYKMWYGGTGNPIGTDYRIGYATSRDGVHWKKDTLNNPVMSFGEPGSWDKYAWGVSLYFDGSNYHMWYAGSPTNNYYSNGCIGYATSPDGIHWTKDTLNNPVFCGTSGWASSLWGLNVIVEGSNYQMWYSGYDGQNELIGYAASSDGINWVGADSAVLPLGEMGEWDDYRVGMPAIFIENSTCHMWYHGARSDNIFKIGYATAPPVGIEVLDVNLPNDYIMRQNYPNPFNPSTTIEFSIPRLEIVTLKIYNLLGQEVATLVSQKLTSGNYKYNWDAGDLTSGVYMYSITAGNYKEVKKLVLVR